MYNSVNYREAVLRFRKLSDAEKQKFIEEELNLSTPNQYSSLEQASNQQRFSKGRFCPYCDNKQVVRNGTRKNGVQKYHCNHCHKSFTATTNTVIAGIHKNHITWNILSRII